MRHKIAILVSLTFTAFMAFADEQLPVLKVGSEVYSNVTVTKVTATDVYFTSANGMANAKLKKLDPALQNHFHYDAAKAEAVEQQQKRPYKDVASRVPDSNDPKAVMDDAIARVQAIVNQPVTQVTRTPDMEVAIYRPGWFHPGAEKPDFNTVDVRATQQGTYDKNEYVSSDENPGVAFLGRELEFNPMTKYFYTDRSLPKKKLSEPEMLEINRLYRVIGSCEEKLKHTQEYSQAAAPNAAPDHSQSSQSPLTLPAPMLGFLSAHKQAEVIALAALILILLAARYVNGRHSEL
jgi:hypothetical protein